MGKRAHQRSPWIFVMVIVVIVVLLAVIWGYIKLILADPHRAGTTKTIDPSQFHSTVTNRYFPLIPGAHFTYQSGTERSEVFVTSEKKVVAGVETVVVQDKVWQNNDLVEDTSDWYAQDTGGNVWYFGEDSRTMNHGAVVSTKGSWEAGVDKAQPGIVMQAAPYLNQTYQQEYYPGKAEDRAKVISLSAQVTVPAGTYTGCLETLETTPLEPDVAEQKYYCPQAGGLALEIDNKTGERLELVSVVIPDSVAPATYTSHPQGTAVSIEEAKQIALNRVPGQVTDVAVETQSGNKVYVVEIKSLAGKETDVMIDMRSGTVTSVE